MLQIHFAVVGFFVVVVFKYIIHQNTFTGSLKKPALKKQHRIISIAHVNMF